jgi:hypothetical protein
VAIELEWLGLAEATAIDQRGSVTLVGFNSGTWEVRAYPSQITLALVAVLSDQEVREGWLDDVPATLSPRILTEQGQVVVAGQLDQVFTIDQGLLMMQPRRKRIINVIVTITFLVHEGGYYTAVLEITPRGLDTISAQTNFRVFSQQQAESAGT